MKCLSPNCRCSEVCEEFGMPNQCLAEDDELRLVVNIMKNPGSNKKVEWNNASIVRNGEQLFPEHRVIEIMREFFKKECFLSEKMVKRFEAWFQLNKNL